MMMQYNRPIREARSQMIWIIVYPALEARGGKKKWKTEKRWKQLDGELGHGNLSGMGAEASERGRWISRNKGE